ncbi:NAD(P)H-binding protein [Palleronia abyssalis]|uniref:Divinyl chlorophyllide a 8-vinyl-reductase, chloroplastic n=1 Tax=Palleronia abyssalis TaxID=1501240 RepID=A0A2R8BT74_9RHOB|nr:NAD(P)H-binding protein [Palleronia abyssalis]SPJ23362.1 hypothetical protein PAA8504_01172 [Palleronia abyssalis]
MTRVLLLGGSGTIGRATAAELLRAAHEVRAVLRSGTVPGCEVIHADAMRDALPLAGIDAVICCLASRTGAPDDARAVDRDATIAAIDAAERAGVAQFVLLSAICVEPPVLAFHHAKLAAEARLRASSMNWSVVRPTAFFKSLSGQVARVAEGKPFLVFGDGNLTACKPISDRDCAAFLVDCLSDPDKRNRVLPVGGPGPAITPMDQAAMLGRLLGREVAVRRVPVALLDGVASGLSLMGRVSPRLAAKAELARIGRFYATRSMLVHDGDRPAPELTPEYGDDRLEDHYAALLKGEVSDGLGAHRVFGRGT